jgi:hypothetical protein
MRDIAESLVRETERTLEKIVSLVNKWLLFWGRRLVPGVESAGLIPAAPPLLSGVVCLLGWSAWREATYILGVRYVFFTLLHCFV